jgi:hypothetical protein
MLLTRLLKIKKELVIQYVHYNAINSGNLITFECIITIPMSTFNLFDKLRYFPTFFGNWTLDIIPTLDNMNMKVVDNSGLDQLTCYHSTKQGAYHCYGIGTPCRFTTVPANTPNAWIQLTPQS